MDSCLHNCLHVSQFLFELSCVVPTVMVVKFENPLHLVPCILHNVKNGNGRQIRKSSPPRILHYSSSFHSLPLFSVAAVTLSVLTLKRLQWFSHCVPWCSLRVARLDRPLPSSSSRGRRPFSLCSRLLSWVRGLTAVSSHKSVRSRGVCCTLCCTSLPFSVSRVCQMEPKVEKYHKYYIW